MASSQTRMTLPDSILGTPEYMSPEQARDDDNIDHRTHLYSPGVVLYGMLSSRPGSVRRVATRRNLPLF